MGGAINWSRQTNIFHHHHIMGNSMMYGGNGDVFGAMVVVAVLVLLYGGVCGGPMYIHVHKDDEKETTRNIAAGGWSCVSLMVWAFTIYHHRYIYHTIGLDK